MQDTRHAAFAAQTMFASTSSHARSARAALLLIPRCGPAQIRAGDTRPTAWLRNATRIGARKGFTCNVKLKRPYALTKVRVTARFTAKGGGTAVRRSFVKP